MTMTPEQIVDILTARPSEDGAITKYDQSGKVPYRIELLPPGQLNELRFERHGYLADRGIEECTPATAEIYDQEFELRVLAAAVRDPDTGEPLASLDAWRETEGAAVRTCLAHYTKLEAQADAIDMARADQLAQFAAYVRQEQGPGEAAFWARVDYETLLACFCALSLEHDRTLEETRTQATDLDTCKRALAAHEPRKKRR
jgi:hypothetical protein